MKKLLILLGGLFWAYMPVVYAGEADVVKVDAKKAGKNTYHFSVTVFTRAGITTPERLRVKGCSSTWG